MKNAFECNRILVENTANSREKLLIRRKQLKNYDLHWHDCFEIELMLRGNAVQNLNGQRYEMMPGDIYLLNPTDFHSIETDGAVVYNIMFSEELLDEEVLQKILSIDKNIIFRLSQQELHTTEFLISRMLYEFENEASFSDSMIKNLMECLFIIILRKCNLSSETENNSENDAIRRAVLYLHSRFRENPSLTQVASVAGLNKNYFSGLFHSATGKTYKEYLNSLKLEHAKKLVHTSNIPVTEVCFAAGFNSLTNFLRAYKDCFGESPATMRKNIKNKKLKGKR